MIFLLLATQPHSAPLLALLNLVGIAFAQW
jgi:hypothetical protein